MKKIISVVMTAGLLLAVLLACGQNEAPPAGGNAAPGAMPVVSAALEWKDRAGVAGREELFAGLDPAALPDKAFWLLYREEGGKLRPAVAVNGAVRPVGPPVDTLVELTLTVTCSGGGSENKLARVIFSSSRVLGPKTPHKDDIYCVAVVPAAVTGRPAAVAASVPEDLRARARRTLALNLAFVADADSFAREIENVFAVTTRYALPRVLVAAEEWMTIPAQPRPAARGGGLFGTPLDETIFGAEPAAPTVAPAYSLDLLLNRIEAEGKHAVAYQTARSLQNDVLEGKIIWQATGGRRRVLTATAVFGQMERNRREKGIANEAVVVTTGNLAALDRCRHLWPSAKAEITAFLAANPGWKVVLPRDPVPFFAGNNPAYGMYAWYQLEPASGRLVGVLPGNLHGASEEWAALGKILGDEMVSQLKDQVREQGGGEGGVRTFFATVAGLYVSSAGILDGVNLTIANPELAALSDAEWKKFLADHAIGFARKFLEDHADLYDAYSDRVGFWGGVAALSANFDGKDAARQCLQNAWEDVAAKAREDAREWLMSKHDELQSEARTQLIEAVTGEMGQRGKIAKELIEQVREKYNLAADAVPDWAVDAAPHVAAIVRELERPGAKPNPAP